MRIFVASKMIFHGAERLLRKFSIGFHDAERLFRRFRQGFHGDGKVVRKSCLAIIIFKPFISLSVLRTNKNINLIHTDYEEDPFYLSRDSDGNDHSDVRNVDEQHSHQCTLPERPHGLRTRLDSYAVR